MRQSCYFTTLIVIISLVLSYYSNCQKKKIYETKILKWLEHNQVELDENGDIKGKKDDKKKK